MSQTTPTRVERDSPSTAYTEALAHAIASVMDSGDVILLSGELGAGKTTLVRSIAAALGVDPAMVSSPTYVMLNLYPAVSSPSAPQSPRAITQVAHLDAYRLSGAEDLDALGWDRVFEHTSGRARAGSVLLVEWPERLAGVFDAEGGRASTIRIEQTGESSRRITLTPSAAMQGREGFALLAEREPIRCRITGKWVSPTSPTYPFIDGRARDADLHRWFSGGYSITRPATPEELEDS